MEIVFIVFIILAIAGFIWMSYKGSKENDPRAKKKDHNAPTP